MLYRNLNLVIRHPLIVVGVLVVAVLLSTGAAMASYAKQRAALQELTELRERQDGCPVGEWRVGQAPNGARFCINPEHWGDLVGEERGVTATFRAIRREETPCPAINKTHKN